MAREIADSDDEIDLVKPAPKTGCKTQGTGRAAAAGTEVAAHEPNNEPNATPDPVLNLDFDAFYSPTQCISSYDGAHETANQLTTSNLLDSSTDRFLNEVAPAPSFVVPAESFSGSFAGEADMGGKPDRKEKASKKRSRTQVDEGRDASSSKEHGISAKRTKTYGSSTTSASNNLFRAAIHGEPLANGAEHDTSRSVNGETKSPGDTIDPADLVSIDERTQYTEPLDLSLHLSPSRRSLATGDQETESLNHVKAQPYIPPQPYTPHASFFGAALQGGTASRSSIGNYQSFSINPNALNLDYSKINPFGSLTQASLDGDDDTEDNRALANIFRNASSKNTTSNSTADGDMLLKNIQDMQTSPEKGSSGVQAPDQIVAQDEPPQASPSFSPITNADDENPSLDLVIPEQDLNDAVVSTDHTLEIAEEPVKAAPKKRGRKPKPKKVEDQVNTNDDVDELQMDTPLVRRTRAGTVDSVSNMSEISQATTSSKSGRKNKSKQASMAPPELSSKRLPSSDLGLDKKDVIGLSPERYVPRPSKRRGRAEPEPVPDDDDPVEVSTNTKEQAQTQDTPDKPTPAKGRKGKKNKVKRAKTAGGALLGKSNDFLDEDEKEEAKEVIFMDERPAKVKSQPLPELSPDRKLKLEETEAGVAEDDGDQNDEEEVKSGGRRNKITIDVPPLTKPDEHEELPPPVPEPKKRGRKKKTKVIEEPIQQPEADMEDEQAEAHQASPIDNPPATLDKDTDKENTSKPSTPPTSKPKSTTPLPPATKQTHSPLKPATPNTLFNARTRIGLSKRHSIPSLLRRIDRTREPPKPIEKKEKMNKARLAEKEAERIAREEAEAEGREYVSPDLMRGKDGLLVEWDF